VEKNQFTFAVTGAGPGIAVGTDVMLIVLDSFKPDADFRIYRRVQGLHKLQTRVLLPPGPLNAHDVEWCQASVAAELYTALAMYKGVQAEFETFPER
jgi:hypothetical protein